jgi:hypothetical protein
MTTVGKASLFVPTRFQNASLNLCLNYGPRHEDVVGNWWCVWMSVDSFTLVTLYSAVQSVVRIGQETGVLIML